MAQTSLQRLREPSVLPGFGLALGFAVTALCLIVLIPLAALVLKAASIGPAEFWAIARDPRTIAALKLSFGAAFIAAAVNAVFGLLLAWVLVRYDFPGKRLIDAAVDLPFALPTAVAGIALTTIYAPNGWIGSLARDLGFKIAYTPSGIVLALIFVGLPFVVRAVQPVLEEVDRDIEEASALLGASRTRTVFRVILPHVYPALLAGFAMALARGIGEYGSVIFIAGNIPRVSEIAPLLIVIKLEEFDYQGATVVAVLMLVIAFLLLLIINQLQAWSRKRLGNV
ncbi:sulfate ABC transporter permease subunit CysT [Aestuariivirga sp.]|uniref:sulfate ABC transporter permease subunit CysT n=1 Tax=Aestuariivirga sp. TaxID=2650926 RepID=UPI0039E58530